MTYPLSGGLTRLSEVEPVEVDWLWEPYIPLGKLTLLEGDPGLGKSWLSLAIASALSLGSALPEGEPSEPRISLLLSAEDGPADTLRPRVDGLGGDPERIVFMDELISLDEEGLPRLEEAIHETGADFVVIDPLVAFVGPSVDIHRANETRSKLAPLALIAERQSCAICLLRHLTKGNTRALYRGLGSIDFTAAARSVLLVAADPDEPTFDRVIAHIKSNLAPVGVSLSFSLRPGVGFSWTGTSDLTGDELLSAAFVPSLRPREIAKAFLRAQLANGPQPSTVVQQVAAFEGISERTLDRAKAEAGVNSERIGFGDEGEWLWSLP